MKEEKIDWYLAFCVICLVLFFFGDCKAQTTLFNTYSVMDSTDVGFYSDSTYITITDIGIRVDGDVRFSDKVIRVDTISSTKKEIYTQGGDRFIVIHAGDKIVYQIKWQPHYGGLVTFFNVNEKR